MTDETQTKFKMKLGAAEIEFEGNPEFLKTEIMPTVEKILGMVESRADLQRASSSTTSVLQTPKLTDQSGDDAASMIAPAADGAKQVGSLAFYLKEKKAETDQNKRFLATAAWLFHRGKKELTAALVRQTLKDHQQSKVANPGVCLNRNKGKGFCEKTNTGFFITPEGWKSLGE